MPADINIKKQKRRILLNFVYILLTIGIIVVFGVLDPNVQDVFGKIGALHTGWFLCIVGATLLFWLFEALILHYLTLRIHKGYTLFRSIKIAMIGLYYSALTPFSSGGQPMQIAYMRNDGVPVGKSTGMFSIKFVIFQVVICLYFFAGMAVNGTYFFQETPSAMWFAFLGIFINVVLALFFVFAMIARNKVQNISLRFIRFLHRIRIIKNVEKATENTTRTLDEFHAGAVFIASHKRTLFGTAALTIVQMFCQFVVTYFIYRAMGLNEHSLWNVVTMQALLYVTVSFVPLPGASIASEGGFYMFFAMFFPSEDMFVAMMLWRLFTYYANIIFGAMFVVFDAVAKIWRNSVRAR